MSSADKGIVISFAPEKAGMSWLGGKIF